MREANAATYRRAAAAVELTTVASMLVMSIVIVAGFAIWIGFSVLVAGIVIYPVSWHLRRRSAEVEWRAIESDRHRYWTGYHDGQ